MPSDESTFTVKLVQSSEPKGVEIEQVGPDDAPALFGFLIDSDYVVIAHRIGSKPVQRREKKQTPPNIVDLENWPGTVDQYEVDHFVFDREAFMASKSQKTNVLRTFQIYRNVSDWKMNVQENVKYLIFLKSIKQDDEMFSTLELDRDAMYYRPYIGSESIFPDPPDAMHGTNNLGRIELGSRYKVLIETIRVLAEALSPPSNEERIADLRKLTDSKNKILSENAKYAIRYLKELNHKTM